MRWPFLSSGISHPIMTRSARRGAVLFLATCASLRGSALPAQSVEMYDLVQFRKPAGTRSETADHVQYAASSGKSFCVLAVYRSAVSTGDAAADFATEWNDLSRNLGVPDAATLTPTATAGAPGFTRVDGRAEISSAQSGRYTRRQLTISGHGRRTSIVTLYTSTSACTPAVDELLASVVPDEQAIAARSAADNAAPSDAPAAAAPPTPEPPPVGSPSAIAGWAFSTTTFDDGWTATAGDTYTQVSKASTRVLLHYARAESREYMSVQAEKTARLWNLLVAPRYSSAQGLYIERYNVGDYEPVFYASANAVEKGTGKSVYVVLFYKQAGNLPWMEFVAPDKAAFDAAFGPYRKERTDFKRWLLLSGRNRFAVAQRDFVGMWSDNFSSATSMVYAATGRSAGMLYTGGSTQLAFTGGKYSMEVSGGSGMTGSIKFRSEMYTGAFAVPDNWTLTLANNFQGQTRKFRAWFEGVVGGRILNLELADPGAPISLHLVRVK